MFQSCQAPLKCRRFAIDSGTRHAALAPMTSARIGLSNGRREWGGDNARAAGADAAAGRFTFVAAASQTRNKGDSEFAFKDDRIAAFAVLQEDVLGEIGAPPIEVL